jgi:hypothetical protein
MCLFSNLFNRFFKKKTRKKRIFKLVDQTELNYAKQGKISFSRPIFSFKGSEGSFIKFAKKIYDRYQKKKLNILPTTADLAEIKKWVDAFRATNNKEDIWGISSEFSIISCAIMGGFCGYFTNENLDNPIKLKRYLKKNALKNKIAYISIDETVYSHRAWGSNNGGFVFCPCNDDDCNYRYKGYLHPEDAIYSDKYDDYLELLKIYNNDLERSAKTWFIFLSDFYQWQNEKRLIFLLESLEPNEKRLACDSVYQMRKQPKSIEDLLFENIVNAIAYASNGPSFLYLSVDPKCLTIHEFHKSKKGIEKAARPQKNEHAL